MLFRNSSNNRYVLLFFIKNSDDIEFSNVEKKLANWHLPMIKPNKIYHTGMFGFFSTMSIKIIE